MTIKLGVSLVAANSATHAATNKKVFDHMQQHVLEISVSLQSFC